LCSLRLLLFCAGLKVLIAGLFFLCMLCCMQSVCPCARA
jgi:hypothetical protein